MSLIHPAKKWWPMTGELPGQKQVFMHLRCKCMHGRGGWELVLPLMINGSESEILSLRGWTLRARSQMQTVMPGGHESAAVWNPRGLVGCN
jgi:cytochrome oxidase assembly protein ShyY1